MGPDLIRRIREKVNLLPESMFAGIDVYDGGGLQGDQIKFYLGPELFKVIFDRLDKIHREKEARESRGKK